MATARAKYVNFETFNFDSEATISNYIDRGAYGEVYGPFLWNSKKCAFKRILIGQDMPDAFKIKVQGRKYIWTSLKHKNLVEIHHVSLREKVVYLVMEYASGGSLSVLLHKSAVSFRVSNWARQIAEGMLYLHEKNIVHRDLKSSNILVMERFNSLYAHKEMTLKITDFDEVKEHNHTTTMSLRGTVAYMAPEVLKTQRFSKASDVWSYGVVMREMLTKELPHKDLEVGAIMYKAFSGEFTLSIPESIPEAYKELLSGCLGHETKSRPSFKEVIGELSSIDKRKDIGKSNQPKEEMNVDDGAQRHFDTDDFPEKYKSDPVLVQTIRTKTQEEKKKPINGSTILDKELFVVSDWSSDVEVYDSKNFSFIHQWNLKELIDPEDIVSCNRNKCLYIFHYIDRGQSTEILRVEPNGKFIKKWSTEDDFGRLSVTDELSVILAVIEKNKLSEYSPDGQLMREINLLSHAGIRNPVHAIKLTNGNFMVSHGDHDDYLHGVCEVDAYGKLEKSFGRKTGWTIARMDLPFNLAVDGNGFVMIADCNNSRVLLLNSDLEFKKEILSNGKHGLQFPKSILLDEENGRLLVADEESDNEGRILIFEFR